MKELAQLVGHRNTIQMSKWERGLIFPSLRNALRLSTALRVPLEVLFYDHFHVIRDEVNERGKNMKLKFHSSPR